MSKEKKIPKEVKESLKFTDEDQEGLKFNSSDKLEAGTIYKQTQEHLHGAINELNLLGAFLTEEMADSKPAALLVLTIATEIVEAGDKLTKALELAKKALEEAMGD